jgi:amino acid transporter
MTAVPALKRGIRFRDLVLFYVVVVMSVRWTATAAAAGPSILVVWIAALVCFFIPLAASVMELSSRHPEEGGIYVWTREAFGHFSGFICAWTYCCILARLQRCLPLAQGHRRWLRILSTTWRSVCSGWA